MDSHILCLARLIGCVAASSRSTAIGANESVENDVFPDLGALWPVAARVRMEERRGFYWQLNLTPVAALLFGRRYRPPLLLLGHPLWPGGALPACGNPGRDRRTARLLAVGRDGNLGCPCTDACRCGTDRATALLKGAVTVAVNVRQAADRVLRGVRLIRIHGQRNGAMGYREKRPSC